MKAHQRPVGLNDEWLTPPEIIEKLGPFDLDPCDAADSPFTTASSSYTENGLEQPWKGRIWLNPPFNRYERPQWMEKMARHGDGIMLIPAATETEAFFKHVWEKANAVCFLRGRPHFYFRDGTRAKANCGCSIALVAYGAHNGHFLEESDLGHMVWIKFLGK